MQRRSLLLFFVSLFWVAAQAQEIKVEYDKNRDLTQYKTFRFGAGEIVTPGDQKRVSDKVLSGWIRQAITKELQLKGLQLVDSTADLVVSYVYSTISRSDMGNLGPMGLTPGSNERTYIRDYQQGSLIIDLNDRNDFLIWRVNSTTNMTATGGERIIDQVVQQGFKQFAKPVKGKKKKK
jgi:hypothetical protein